MAEGDFDSVSTKQLKGPIRELISGNHRISYFLEGSLLCFVRGFPKKTNKTPKKEIEFAEKIRTQLKQSTQNKNSKNKTKKNEKARNTTE
jgi:phage-related protein